jgi:hypothetical protein
VPVRPATTSIRLLTGPTIKTGDCIDRVSYDFDGIRHCSPHQGAPVGRWAAVKIWPRGAQRPELEDFKQPNNLANALMQRCHSPARTSGLLTDPEQVRMENTAIVVEFRSGDRLK